MDLHYNQHLKRVSVPLFLICSRTNMCWMWGIQPSLNIIWLLRSTWPISVVLLCPSKFSEKVRIVTCTTITSACGEVFDQDTPRLVWWEQFWHIHPNKLYNTNEEHFKYGNKTEDVKVRIKHTVQSKVKSHEEPKEPMAAWEDEEIPLLGDSNNTHAFFKAVKTCCGTIN